MSATGLPCSPQWEKSGKIIKATIEFTLLIEKGQIGWKDACGGGLAQNFHT